MRNTPRTDELGSVRLCGRAAGRRGDTLGAVVPAAYDLEAIELRAVPTVVHDLDFNFGVKILF